MVRRPEAISDIDLGDLADQTGQHVQVEDLVADSHNHFLLALGAIKVAAVGMTLAGISQGIGTAKRLSARLQGFCISLPEGIDGNGYTYF